MNGQPKNIGRFKVLSTLGVGGMGTVYLAEDPDIGRKVAIKVLHASRDENSLKRFKLEAKTLGDQVHPNVVVLLEYGINNSQPYLVMEYLPGEPLDRWLKSPRKLSEHKEILLGLCNALSYLHHKNIIHRDLKSSNLQVLPSGASKLLDFGIAQTHDSQLTATGFFIGSPQYLAPEILNRSPHSKVTDCYSLGLIAYNMLRGSDPFDSNSMEGVVMRKISITPTPLHKLNPGIPKSLSTVISHYLEKDPSVRPKTPDLLIQELEKITSKRLLDYTVLPVEYLEDISGNNKLPQYKGHNKKFNILAVTAMISAVSFGSWYFYNQQQIAPQQITSDITEAEIASEQIITNVQTETPKETSTIEENKTIKTTALSQKPVIKLNNANLEDNTIEFDRPTTLDTMTETEPVTDSATQAETSVRPAVQSTPEPIVKIKQPEPYQPKQEVSNEDSGFQLPVIGKLSEGIRIKALSGMVIPRGRSTVIEIETRDNLDVFEVYLGRNLYDKVKVIRNRKIKSNLYELTIYADSNAKIGQYSIIAKHKEQKSNKILLEVTL